MPGTQEFAASYIRLRTLLDALHANTLRYCIEAEGVDAKIERINQVEAEIRQVVKSVGGDGPCEQGYYLCDGVCVPYQCFQAEFLAAKKRPDGDPTQYRSTKS